MIVFLDVDGTYAHHGRVPAAHAAAVRAARARGHHVLLCTGRPRSMLTPGILGAGFDGVVASAGAHVEIDGRVLQDLRFPAELADRTVKALDAHAAAYLLETPDELLGPTGIDVRLAAAFRRRRVDTGDQEQQGAPDFLARLRTSEDLQGSSFSKVTVFDSPVAVDELGALIGPGVATLPSSIPEMGSSAGEIYLAGIDKALGAQVAADHLGVARADTVAVGDGINDLEVLAWAGTGVAIEGSDPRVLAVADRLAAGPQDAGLVALFAELGLTEG